MSASYTIRAEDLNWLHTNDDLYFSSISMPGKLHQDEFRLVRVVCIKIVSSSAATAQYPVMACAFLTDIIMSVGSDMRPLFKRKNSRTSLLSRLRMIAPPTLALTARPSRVVVRSFGMSHILKLLVERLLPRVFTFLNSSDFKSRSFLVKVLEAIITNHTGNGYPEVQKALPN